MLDLAYHSKAENVPLSIIAKRQQVSEKYMEQVFSLLKKNGLVIGSKGALGGYMLSNKPENVTVGDVLTALEGDLAIVPEKVHEENENNHEENIMDSYLYDTVWRKVNEKIYNIVSTTSLQNLLDEHAEKFE